MCSVRLHKKPSIWCEQAEGSKGNRRSGRVKQQLRTENATYLYCSCCTEVCYLHDSAGRFESLRSPNQMQLEGW